MRIFFSFISVILLFSCTKTIDRTEVLNSIYAKNLSRSFFGYFPLDSSFILEHELFLIKAEDSTYEVRTISEANLLSLGFKDSISDSISLLKYVQYDLQNEKIIDETDQVIYTSVLGLSYTISFNVWDEYESSFLFSNRLDVYLTAAKWEENEKLLAKALEDASNSDAYICGTVAGYILHHGLPEEPHKDLKPIQSRMMIDSILRINKIDK